MEKYDYRQAVKDDVIQYINDNVDMRKFADPDDACDALYDDMFVDDCITGKGRGSYTFSALEAEENLRHNMDLLAEACEGFGLDMAKQITEGAEACDVIIRCYLLIEVLTEVLDYHEYHTDEEEEEESDEE